MKIFKYGLLFIVLAFICIPADAGAKKFSGEVISLDESVVIVKKGSVEKQFAIDASTAIRWAKKLKKTEAAAVELCQWVTIEYTASGAVKKAQSVEIYKTSECIK